MDNMSNNLFGFLQKPSLFQNSPMNSSSRRRSRSRSRSKDSRVSDKLSNINALEEKSMESSSKVQQRGQKFNYQYVNPPQNRLPQQKGFRQVQQNVNKAVTSSFTRNVNLQPLKNPVDISPATFQSTPNFVENSQKYNHFDHLRAHQSNLSNNLGLQSNIAGSFVPNPNHNYTSAIVGNNNNNQPPGMFQTVEKLVKNADYNSTRFQPTSPKSIRGNFDMRSDRFRQQDDQISNFNKSIISQQQNKVWTDLVSYTSSFEAAKVQSIQCLQSLSVRIGSQISNINVQIQSLNAKMAAVLNRQFQQIRRRIIQIIENAFREKQKFIYDYMNKKQVQLAGQMIKVREILQKQGENVEKMKQRLKTSQWRQAAGEILSSQMEKKVEAIIQKSHQMHLGQWEVGDIGSHHLKNIQKQFKELMSLNNK